MTRILLADDHDLVRETLAAFMQSRGFAKVQVVANLDDAIAEVSRTGSFDLVLIDYDMPGMNGLEGLARMMAANGGPVALISGNLSQRLAQQAQAMGAVGYVPKTIGAVAMVAAAQLMVNGERYFPIGMMQPDIRDSSEILSPREVDVLRGICAGKSNKEIGRDLDLQEVTVKLHVKTMSRKLGAKNRTHAAMIARDQSLV